MCRNEMNSASTDRLAKVWGQGSCTLKKKRAQNLPAQRMCRFWDQDGVLVLVLAGRCCQEEEDGRSGEVHGHGVARCWLRLWAERGACKEMGQVLFW